MIFSTEYARVSDETDCLWRVEYRVLDHSKGSTPKKVTYSTWFASEESAKKEAEELRKTSRTFYVAISKWKRDEQ